MARAARIRRSQSGHLVIFWLVISACSPLGCSAARAGSPAQAQSAPRADSAARAKRALDPPHPAATEPAARNIGCSADAGAQRWLGSSGAPESGWWQEFSRRHPQRVKPLTRGGWAPIAELQIFGANAASNILRVQQSWLMGPYKLCYREALYEDLSRPGRANRPPLQGDWVARFTQQGDRVCAVEVLETSLPEAVSECLRNSALQQPHAGSEPGRFELALIFRVPVTLPPPSGKQSAGPLDPAD